MRSDEAMNRIESRLSHVWMVRTFLKHSDEAVSDEQLNDIQRTLYDYMLALGKHADDADADAYVKQARKKFSKLRQATELFVQVQPEVSGHMNYRMAVRSLLAAVAEVGEILDQVEQPR